MALMPGTKFGPYEIQSLLGAGGMGEVYRALDTRLQRTVAIKVLPAHLSANPELHTRFAHEAKSISGLQHPNICVVHDIGSQDFTLSDGGCRSHFDPDATEHASEHDYGRHFL